MAETDPSALAGRTAVVTGASRGIGLAIAQALVGAGARVAMLARSADVLAREAAALGEWAVALPCDLADAGAVDGALARIGDRLGTPDILVHNAGAFAIAAVGHLAPTEVERLVTLNLLTPYRFANALVPAMRERGSGHVVTIGSVADRQAFTGNAGYAASKFGARAMHEVLRAELRSTGVRVSLVSPAAVDTSLWDAIGPDTRPGFTPRALMLRAADVADAVLWAVTRRAEVNVDELRLSRS
jgi:NADP-dependent 3-hydroxy acid dehydrogenase YdfG